MAALWQIAGVEDLPPEDVEIPADARALLVEHARLFLVAGGHVSLAEWDQLDDDERAAFVVAGRHVAVDQAVRIGTAARGDIAALRVRAEVDGGEAHDDALLEAAVRLAAAESRGVTRGA